MVIKQHRWYKASSASIPLNCRWPITNTDPQGRVTTVLALDTRRSTEKELLHRWALMSMRFDYHKIWFPTASGFWKKSRRQRQDKLAAQGSNALTSGYDMTTWFLERRGDLQKHQESQEERSPAVPMASTKPDSCSRPAAPLGRTPVAASAGHTASAGRNTTGTSSPRTKDGPPYLPVKSTRSFWHGRKPASSLLKPA